MGELADAFLTPALFGTVSAKVAPNLFILTTGPDIDAVIILGAEVNALRHEVIDRLKPAIANDEMHDRAAVESLGVDVGPMINQEHHVFIGVSDCGRIVKRGIAKDVYEINIPAFCNDIL